MTIKQKIKLSNVLMALIPILLTAVIVVICISTSLGSYWYTLETMYQGENGNEIYSGHRSLPSAGTWTD